jgi:predicted transcriptional regulator
MESDLQLSKVLRVKGNDDTAKKEISRSLKRLETAGAIKREYVKLQQELVKSNKEVRLIIPLL